VGAWIETAETLQSERTERVAPCVGAWIETRALKSSLICENVAPCVGAWIETNQKAMTHGLVMSRPAWARGLKLNVPYFVNNDV